MAAKKAAKKKATSKLPPGIPDRAVDQETLLRFFGPPIGKSTFYNLVRRGVIVKIKEVQGYYLLNESLVRLGLPHVSELPATPDAAQRERQLLEFAMSLAAPDVVAQPSWMLGDDRLTDHEKSHVALLALHHQREMADLTLQPVRLAYVRGVFDAFEMLNNPLFRGSSPD
jgi:hypothetical protein